MSSETADHLTAAGERPSARTWLVAVRPQQSSKNLILFVPLLLGHQWSNTAAILQALAAFVLLVAVTSATYLINDVIDRDADARHATKHLRPVASGALPVSRALIAAALLLSAALLLGVAFDLVFGLLLLTYVVVTGAYSLFLKHIPLLDVLVIAALITLRLAMGSSFIDEVPPVWLFTFSIFFFFSLAMAKRHTEVVRARDVGGDSLADRGYEPGDWPLTLAFGISAGLASLVVLVFYLVEQAFRTVGYSRPALLWGIVAAVAIWLGRIWLLTHRGKMNDDPVSFALSDRSSLAIGLAVALLFIIAV